MAIGTVTIVAVAPLPTGEQVLKVAFAGDDDYPTGGTVGADITSAVETAIATAAGLATDANIKAGQELTVVEVIAGDCGQYVPTWTGGKLKVLDGGDAARAEAANHADLSGTTFNVSLVCK